MDIEKVKKAAELNEMLSGLINNKSNIQRAIVDKKRESREGEVFRYYPRFFAYHVCVHEQIEDELMEVAIALLDKKIEEVNKEISEL